MNKTKSLTMTLTVPAALVDHLCVSSTKNFIGDQPDRFWTYDDPDLPDPHSSLFASGTLMWTATTADALLLRSCEESAGYEVTILFDEADYSEGPVVLTSRHFGPTDRPAIR